MIARPIEVATHGRYLVEPPTAPESAATIVGFHGYAEGAEQALDRLRAMRDAGRLLLVAIQGLNRFYQRRTDEVIAGWMTRQDRDLAIADNIAYVNAVLDAVGAEWPTTGGRVFAGFSQGTAMAFRAAAASTRPIDAVIAVGGDIPPEIDDAALRRAGRVLICRGRLDSWYTSNKLAADATRLRHAGVDSRIVEFDGGHEWSAAVIAAVDDFLAPILR